MIDKTFHSVRDALFDLHDGANIMIGGLGGAGNPHNLVNYVAERGVKDLTLICNGFNNVVMVKDWRTVRKVVMSYPLALQRRTRPNPLAEGIELGQIEVEVVPQGTLAERIRAGGSGLAAFYTPVGAGTELAKDKEARDFDGKTYVLETAIRADLALIKAWKADSTGNLVYRKSARNFNPLMAMAAKVVVAEVEQIVPPGELDGDIIHTPGIFVDRIVQQKAIVAPIRPV